MKYAQLGQTGLIVSRLAYGAMTFTSDTTHGAIFKTEAAEADAIVGRAIDAGINFFDTANVYAAGQSEEMLGKALAPRRDELVIATKVANRVGPGVIQAGLSRQHILWSVDQSLRRLGTDRIDVLIAHKEDLFTPLEETLEALDAVVRAGKARYIGFSNWSAWRAAAAFEMQKANGWARFTHGQMYYSLVGRDIENDVIPMMAHLGLGLTVWSPLAGGFLSGKYKRDAAANPGDRLAGFRFLPIDEDKGYALVEEMRGIADGLNASVAQVALAWLLSKPAVTSLIVGASRSAQLEDNLGAIDLVLPEEAITTLDAAVPPPATYPAWFLDKTIDGRTAKALGRPAPNTHFAPKD